MGSLGRRTKAATNDQHGVDRGAVARPPEHSEIPGQRVDDGELACRRDSIWALSRPADMSRKGSVPSVDIFWLRRRMYPDFDSLCMPCARGDTHNWHDLQDRPIVAESARQRPWDRNGLLRAGSDLPEGPLWLLNAGRGHVAGSRSELCERWH
jgi:hypothetical protein